MRILPVAALTLLVASRGAAAQRQTLDFEDLPQVLPANYGGFIWSTDFNQWELITAGDQSPSYLSRPSSGVTNVALLTTSFSTFARPGGPFDLISVYLGVSYFSDDTKRLPINIRGYLNNVQIYIASIVASETTIDKYEFDFEGVDKVSIETASFGRILVDDITVTSTPEPGTLMLFATGFVILLGFHGGSRYKRRRSPSAA